MALTQEEKQEFNRLWRLFPMDDPCSLLEAAGVDDKQLFVIQDLLSAGMKQVLERQKVEIQAAIDLLPAAKEGKA